MRDPYGRDRRASPPTRLHGPHQTCKKEPLQWRQESQGKPFTPRQRASCCHPAAAAAAAACSARTFEATRPLIDFIIPPPGVAQNGSFSQRPGVSRPVAACAGHHPPSPHPHPGQTAILLSHHHHLLFPAPVTEILEPPAGRCCLHSRSCWQEVTGRDGRPRWRRVL